MVYGADIDTVLTLFSKALEEDKDDITHNFDFYHACLDKIDILLTEKNSSVS